MLFHHGHVRLAEMVQVPNSERFTESVLPSSSRNMIRTFL